MDAADALEDHGTLPPGTAPESFRIRPVSLILSKDTPWVEGAREHLVAP
jgi:hypothetical protein